MITSSPVDASVSLFAFAIPANPIRLDGSNFLLWKMLILPNLSGLNLHGYLDDNIPPPEKLISDGDETEAKLVPNFVYQEW